MDPESSTSRSQPATRQAANPLAVGGVLLIVVLSVLLGVFGPQVSDYRRGQFVSGRPVIDLLEGMPSVYFRVLQEMSRSTRRSGSAPAIVSNTEVQRLLIDRFGSLDPPFLPAPSVFNIVGVDEEVDLLPFQESDTDSEPGFSLLYLPDQPLTGRDEGVVLLVQRLGPNAQMIYQRNEFGVPKPIEEGSIHRDLMDGGRSQLSLIFWSMNGFFYVLAASDQDLLDAYLGSLDLNPLIEDPVSSV